MNAEYVWWFAILVAVGVGAVAYLALGPIPEIAGGDPPVIDDGPAAQLPTASASGGDAEARTTSAGADAGQSSPVSTTEPGPGDPPSTRETP
jgi:hypothetical protein